jgi:hypothetical protein
MMKELGFFVAVLSFSFSSSYGQINIKPDTASFNLSGYIDTTTMKDMNFMVTNPRYKAQFSGGKTAWKQFLLANINVVVPLIKHAPTGNYLVRVRYVVDKSGALRDFGAESNCGYGMEDELIRCLKTSPAWVPANLEKGIKVSTTMRQFVTFRVKGYDCKLEVE